MYNKVFSNFKQTFYFFTILLMNKKREKKTNDKIKVKRPEKISKSYFKLLVESAATKQYDLLQMNARMHKSTTCH